MATAIRISDWLEQEDAIRREMYWQQVVQGWLWQIPFAVVRPELAAAEASRPQAPSRQALQNYGWLKEPHSTLSH
jgi:hypothetical protein